MKPLRFLPLAYLADVHGFIYFVPYMLFVMAIAQVLAVSRRRASRVIGGRLAPSIDPVDSEEVGLAVVRS